MNIVSLILKFCGLGLVVCAAGLWIGAGLEARTKIRDEQTLVSGAIWTQTLIPIGLIISAIVGDKLNIYLHAYYLLAGGVISGITGALMVVRESLNLKKQRRTRVSFRTSDDESPVTLQVPSSFDKIYFAFGCLMCLASILTFADLTLNMFK